MFSFIITRDKAYVMEFIEADSFVRIVLLLEVRSRFLITIPYNNCFAVFQMLMNVNPSRICAIHYELIALTPWDLTTVVANQATKEMASVVYVGECDLPKD